MMILRRSPASPFARKVQHRRKRARPRSTRSHSSRPTPTTPADTSASRIRSAKFPTLVLEDGTTLFDSRVILEYLDHRAGGGRIIPQEPAARFAALRLQALADGMTDASILLVYEGRWRPAEHHEPKWVDHQAGKVARALAALEAEPPVARCDARMSARSRSPARSAIAISASPASWRQGPSAAGRLARRFRRAGAGVRRDQAAGSCSSDLRCPQQTKKPRTGSPGLRIVERNRDPACDSLRTGR